MNGLQNLLNGWLGQWREWSAPQRIAVACGVLICLALVAGVGVWATRPEFVILADRLSPGDAAEIVSALETQGIPYKLSYSGSAVMAPQSQISTARLAIKDIAPAAAADEAPEYADSLWADPSLTHVRLLREQELRLARSIARMRSVKEATVHLTRPEPSPFVRDRVPTKASVVLDLQPGAPFTSSDAQSIIALVSHGVEGLTAENVSVLDTSGRHLSSSQGLDADISGRLAYRQQIETSLAAKAEAMLAQLLGPGNAVVRVTADVDFTESTRTETIFDPDAKVKISETIESSTSTGSAPAGQGEAGTASNLAIVSGDPTASPILNKMEKNEVTYDNAKTEDKIHKAAGTIQRMTVAAVVHLPEAADGEQQPQINEAEIEAIIKQAVGFDEARTDAIEVLMAGPRAADPLALAAPAGGWQEYEGLIRAASLGIAALAALTCVFLVLRRLRPLPASATADDALSLEAARRLAELSRKVQGQPDAAARVLAAWLNDSEEEEAPRQKAAA